MKQAIIQANFTDHPASLRSHPLCPPVAADMLNRHAPSAHYQLLRDDVLNARCSIWTNLTPTYDCKPAGVIGHYAAADIDAGSQLLSYASDQLQQRGFTTIIGPMDGTTWRSYRLVTHRGNEPPFFLEPDNPPDWPDHFNAAGFSPLADYFSSINSNLDQKDPRVPAALNRMQDAGIRIRPIDPSRFQSEIEAIYDLSIDAFANNFLYTPITLGEFFSMYAPVQPYLQPKLVLMAEKDSKLVGFIFGLPDLLQAKRGQLITTGIAKTLAVRPGRTGAGLGSILLDQFQQSAHRLGFTRVIHALMHQDNTSRKLSQRYGQPFRQYTLYRRKV